MVRYEKFRFSTTISKYVDLTFQDNRVTRGYRGYKVKTRSTANVRSKLCHFL